MLATWFVLVSPVRVWFAGRTPLRFVYTHYRIPDMVVCDGSS